MLLTSLTSPLVIQSILNGILKKANQQANQREFVRNNMNEYCSNRVISLVNQLGDQLLATPIKRRPMFDQNQPTKLYGDTFMPITNIQHAQHPQIVKQQSMSEHKSATDRSARKMKKKESNSFHANPSDNKSQVSAKPKRIKQVNEDKFMKINQQLPQTNIEDEKQIIKKRMEKQQQQREQNQKNNQKIHKNKTIRNNKQGMNFDYDGKLIEVRSRSDKKSNLVSKLVMSKIPSDLLDKQPKGNQNNFIKQTKVPTFIQTHQVNKEEQGNIKKSNREKARIVQKKQQAILIQFSKINNPFENIEVKKGVKAIFDKNTIEQKQKQPSNEQLRKTIVNRKLSKNQYSRIKTATLRNTPQILEPNVETNVLNKQPLQNEPEQIFPSRISSMRKKRSVTQFDDEKIQIKDEYLKNYMIQKNSQPSSKKQSKKVLDIDSRPCSEHKHKQKLSRIDKYNLDYSRHKTQYENLNKLSETNMLLPKLQSLRAQPQPKIREKLKDGSIIRRDLVKKFQETLRV